MYRESNFTYMVFFNWLFIGWLFIGWLFIGWLRLISDWSWCRVSSLWIGRRSRPVRRQLGSDSRGEQRSQNNELKKSYSLNTSLNTNLVKSC